MTQIDFSGAKDFLENVSKKDKVGIVTHDDMDGMVSGVLFYDYCKQMRCEDVKHFSFTLGKTHLGKLDLEDRTKLLIADVGQNLLLPDLNAINVPVFYTDHHLSESLTFNENVSEYRTDSEGYFPSSKTIFQLCGGKDWMSLIGVFSDFGDKYPENKLFVETILKKYDKSANDFGREFVYPAANFLIYFEHDLERAFNFLTKVKDLSKFSRVRKFANVIDLEIKCAEQCFHSSSEKLGDVQFYMLESPHDIKTAFINRVSAANPHGVYVIGYDYNGHIGIGARNQANLYNMRELLKVCTSRLEGVSTGGHSAAAGAKIHPLQLEEFKQNLKRYNLQNVQNK